MKGGLRQWILYIFIGIIFACGIELFALDSANSKKPQLPNPAIGRVISHQIKGSGIVFLTSGEYEPYRWLMGIVFSCIVLMALVQIVGYFQEKSARTR